MPCFSNSLFFWLLYSLVVAEAFSWKNPQPFHITQETCTSSTVNITASEGIIYFIDNFTISPAAVCFVHIQVPEGKFVFIEVSSLGEKCLFSREQSLQAAYSFNTTGTSMSQLPEWHEELLRCSCSLHPRYFIYDRNYVSLKYIVRGVLGTTDQTLRTHKFSVRFAFSDQYDSNQFRVIKTSAMSGYLMPPSMDNGFKDSKHEEGWFGRLFVPRNYSFMISFPEAHFFGTVNFTAYEDSAGQKVKLRWSQNERRASLAARVFTNVSLFAIELYRQHKPKYRIEKNPSEIRIFKLLYTFHLRYETPEELKNGVFNCVDHYSSFKQHLDCNLETECQDGEDETAACPYSSAACQGKVSAGNKCFLVLELGNQTTRHFSWNKAADECRGQGGRLITVKSRQDKMHFLMLLDLLRFEPGYSYIGIKHSYPSYLQIYSIMFRWLDNTNVYAVDHAVFEIMDVRPHDQKCGIAIHLNHMSIIHLKIYECYWNFVDDHDGSLAMCEMAVNTDSMPSPNKESLNKIINVSAPLRSWNFGKGCCPDRTSTLCPKGHITHTFLSCDILVECGKEKYVSKCPITDVTGKDENYPVATTQNTMTSVSMFECDDELTTIPYTLVCDFQSHCPDESDEIFCKHTDCHQTCKFLIRDRNAGTFSCVSEFTSDWCKSPCSGLRSCSGYNPSIPDIVRNMVSAIRPPAIIDPSPFSQEGFITTKKLSDNASCPDTHFRCPGEMNYCMPVYMRCNGYFDCLGGEDEQGCQGSTCPGLYHCRGSSVCVHANHICDGRVQCPQRDDEWMCKEELLCPIGCLCQGLAFVCPEIGLNQHLPQLRYLDVKNGHVFSLLSPHSRQYLIYLAIRNSSLQSLPEVELPNLKYLDLSRNNIELINTTIFHAMPNLIILLLAENPLNMFISHGYDFPFVSQVQQLDLRHTNLKSFDNRPLGLFRNLQQLDISHSKLLSVGAGGFKNFSRLRLLDLRGNSVNEFPPDIFYGLDQLTIVFSSNYRLCCTNVLPAISATQKCITDVNTLSSCENLLRSSTYQTALFIQSFVAVIGSVVCCTARSMKYNDYTINPSFSVLMTNLNLANCLNGIYTAIIAFADEHYRDVYIYHERIWKESDVCKTAGFLSVLSQQVSALMVLFITVDSWLSFQCQNSCWRFNQTSTTVTSVLSWCSGALLAAVPLVVPHWGMYNSTAVCAPLPGDSTHLGAEVMSSLQVVQLILLVLPVSLLQIYFYVYGKSASVHAITTSLWNSADLTRVLFPAVVIDCICRAVLGCVGLASSSGVNAIEQSFRIGLAIFVQHINSAIVPCLYIISLIREDSKKKTEQKLFSLLKLRNSMN